MAGFCFDYIHCAACGTAGKVELNVHVVCGLIVSLEPHTTTMCV